MKESTQVGLEITYETAPSRQIHWHDTLQIHYLLTGKARVSLQGQQYLMHEADLVVVNPFERHNVELLGASTALSFCFERRLLSRLEGVQFDCVSCRAGKRDSARFDPIRTALAVLFRLYFSGQAGSLELLSHTYELLHLLSTRFRGAGVPVWDVNQPRISRILEYLNTHYAEEITLRDLARQEYLSANYLSQFFRDKLDTTFTQYLGEIRLDHGFFELVNTSKSITDIALDNGFGRVDTFIERFRRKYGVTPGKYRKGMPGLHETGGSLLPAREPSAAREGARFQALLRYAAPAAAPEDAQPLCPQRCEVTVPGQPGRPLHHDWREILNAGYADDLCTAEVQEQLQAVQREIGFRFVRFHGIFSDSMRLYEEDRNGRPHVNFTYAALLLDRLLAMGLRIHLDLSFLPETLASRPEPVYKNRSFISYPNDLDKWVFLVRTFLERCIARYGLREVLRWRFTLFSITFAQYGFLSMQEYETLYRATYQAVKAVHPDLPFGGPGMEGSLLLEDGGQAARDFLKRCRQAGCLPDFFTIHVFPHSFGEITRDFNRMAHRNDPTAFFTLSSNEDFMADAIRAARRLLEEEGLAAMPVMVDEWNATLWQRDLCSDTCYKAVYLVKNLLENMDNAMGKAYWTVSDLINDWKVDDKPFHGGHGMFTYNGIPKPAFYAFQLLAQMGETYVASGKGWFVTRSQQGVQVMLYHYCHYHIMYRMLFAFPDSRERYSAFEQKAPVEYHLSFPDEHAGRFELEYRRIGRSSGSALDEWLRMGRPDCLDRQVCTYLRRRSEPVQWREQRVDLNDICVALEPLEVVLIRITPVEQGGRPERMKTIDTPCAD